MKLVQTVPNYSEGRNTKNIEAILQAFQNKEGVTLLNHSSDKDHNRSVVTVVGEPKAIQKALLESFKIAKETIDMRDHSGQHPRMGAIDVVPFIPIQEMTMEECSDLARETAFLAHKELDLGFFFYEETASSKERMNLANIRKGEYEGMKEKTLHADWLPDVGTFQERTGITAIGARMPLIAFNVILNTNNVDIASTIAKSVRHLSGGLRFVKAIGIDMPERNCTQVSMNLTNYKKTPIYRAVELIKIEARRYGVEVIGSELIGLAPMDALLESAAYYLQIEGYSSDQILEKHLMGG